MNVYKKLQQARVRLQATELKKSGKNTFAKYSYFELGDFLPTIQTIFDEIGLCGAITFGKDYASLSIFDVDKPEDFIVFASPMAEADLKSCHPIQNLGAVQTYLRRYLWVTAMEIVEHDAIDATIGNEKPASKAKPSEPGQQEEVDDVKFDEYIKMIKKAQDMESLKKTWVVIPKLYRDVLADVKDNQKRVIEAMETK